jgi:hypothetical protein
VIYSINCRALFFLAVHCCSFIFSPFQCITTVGGLMCVLVGQEWYCSVTVVLSVSCLCCERVGLLLINENIVHLQATS